MRVTYPVRARAPKLLGRRRPFILDRVGYQQEEAPQHEPEPRALNASASLFEVCDQRCGRSQRDGVTGSPR